MLTDFELLLGTARSTNPSPLKSPVASSRGLDAGKLVGARNVPSPFPRMMLIALPEFETARSATPSLLKSATTTAVGRVRQGKQRHSGKSGTRPDEHANTAGTLICTLRIENSISVKIADGQTKWSRTDLITHRRLKSSVAIPKHYTDSAVKRRDNRYIQVAVAIEIPNDARPRGMNAANVGRTAKPSLRQDRNDLCQNTGNARLMTGIAGIARSDRTLSRAEQRGGHKLRRR